jgi:hypothetical protein
VSAENSLYLPRKESKSDNDYLLRVILLVSCFLLVGPVGLFLGAYSSRILKTRSRFKWRLFLYGTVFFGIWYAALRISQLLQQAEHLFANSVLLTLKIVAPADATTASEYVHAVRPSLVTTQLVSFWLLNLPLVPIGVVMWNLFHELWSFVRPRTIAEQVALEQERAQGRTNILPTFSSLMEAQEPPLSPGRVLFGRVRDRKGQPAAKAGIVQDRGWAVKLRPQVYRALVQMCATCLRQ